MTIIEEDSGVEEDSGPPVAPPRRSISLVRTQRTLQIVLGLFWLLDAGLQFQPFMFGERIHHHLPLEQCARAA